jgi:hypothetical protein
MKNSVEENRQQLAELKDHLNTLTRLVAETCRAAAEQDDAGGAASHLCVSRRDAQTLADWAATFGGVDDLGIEPETPIGVDVRWLRAILDTDDPAHWREVAQTEQWSARQIRKQAGVKKYERKGVRVSTPATLSRWRDGEASFAVPLGEDAPAPDGAEVVLSVKNRR